MKILQNDVKKKDINIDGVEIQALRAVEDYFKKNRIVASSKEFAEIIQENQNGLSDIKAGRKNLKVSSLISLKISHPDINLDFFTDTKKSMFVEKKIDSNSDDRDNYIESLEDEVKRLESDLKSFKIDNEKLKEEIKLKQDKIISLQDKLINIRTSQE